MGPSEISINDALQYLLKINLCQSINRQHYRFLESEEELLERGTSETEGLSEKANNAIIARCFAAQHLAFSLMLHLLRLAPDMLTGH
jgi:hypothetical protein